MNSKYLLPLTGLVSGVVFGLGLSLSQMTNPEKILAFLDIFGNWDPSLLFTMAASVLVTSIGYRIVLHKGPIFNGQLHLPTRSDIDTRLLLGSAIFGVGWGLAGYCPGPAITGLTSGLSEPVVFMAAMIAGSQLERLWLLRHPLQADG